MARRPILPALTLIVAISALPAAAADVLVVRVPVGSDLARCDGCAIERLALGGGGAQPRLLTGGFAAARDPAVSPDGREILFAGRRSAGDHWQIWRVTVDGSRPEQVIAGPGDATSPRWAGSIFHLDDERPTERIVYVSSARGWPDENGGGIATALFSADLDGGRAGAITYNLGSDLEPDMLPDGRVVFSSWRRDAGGVARQVLLAVNIDGTDLMPYALAHDGPTFVHWARVGDDGLLWIIEGQRAGRLGGGDLGAVAMRRPLHGHRLVARGGGGSWASPLPLTGGGLLASYRASDKDARYEVWRIDPASGARRERVAADPAADLLAVAELARHPRVPGRSSVVNEHQDSGVFYCLNAHRSDRPGLDRLADATTLRVVEGRPVTGSTAGAAGGAVRRMLGEAPLAADGSFHVAVPAHTPLAFELLDRSGRVVARQDGWTWVMPNERRGCIGCHEDRELTPPNRLAAAVLEPPVALARPPAETDAPPTGAP